MNNTEDKTDNRIVIPAEHISDQYDLREYAAIHLRIPDSGIDWLDEMIAKAERRDIAVGALPGLINGLMKRYEQPGYLDSGMIHEAAIRALEIVDAIIAKRAKEK